MRSLADQAVDCIVRLRLLQIAEHYERRVSISSDDKGDNQKSEQ
jgi:hypothetical protein